MNKLKCPKCRREIKDDEKYCRTCGLCLKNISKERAIELLELDLAGYKMRLDSVVNTGDIKLFSEKVKTLEMAIKALEKIAQEVSVQEQSDTFKKIKLTDIVSEMIKKTNKH